MNEEMRYFIWRNSIPSKNSSMNGLFNTMHTIYLRLIEYRMMILLFAGVSSDCCHVVSGD